MPYLNLDPNIRAPGKEYKELSVRYFVLGGKIADFLNLARPIRPKVKRPSSRYVPVPNGGGRACVATP